MRSRRLRTRLKALRSAGTLINSSGLPSASTQSPLFPCNKFRRKPSMITKKPPGAGRFPNLTIIPRVASRAPPGRVLALCIVGLTLPATLSGALSRPSLVYPLASLDVSGQWLVYHTDASPNEVIQLCTNIMPEFHLVNTIRLFRLPLTDYHGFTVNTLPAPRPPTSGK